jgi:hypothetical protein
MEREEHEARMALLAAQTRAAESQTPATAEKKPFDWEAALRETVLKLDGLPVYDCGGKLTTVPQVGCVVKGFRRDAN